MHRLNNAVIMQTEQLRRIKALEEELRSSRGNISELGRPRSGQAFSRMARYGVVWPTGVHPATSCQTEAG